MDTVRRFIAWFVDDISESDCAPEDEQLFKIGTLEDAARVAMAAHSGRAG
jgi:hypothetical protein